MPRSPSDPRHIVKILLCGLFVAAACSGEPGAAAAFGFGRMGGFGRPMLGAPAWRRLPPPRGGGRVVGRYPGRPGSPTRHPPIARGGGVVGGGIVGGGIVGGGIAGGANARGAGGGNGGGAAPPQGNQPFVPDEIVTSFAPGTTLQPIDQFARRYDLTQMETQSFPLFGASLYRWRIGGGRTVASVVQALGNENIVASVQPNYVFSLQDDAAKISPAAPGDAAQYVLAALQIQQAQQIATGKSVLVAVIDSEIDATHPDLGGAIVKSFDAIGGGDKPHPHGTSIAGAIAAHGKLMGIAPGVRNIGRACASTMLPAWPRARLLPSTRACNGRQTTVRAS